MGAQDYYSTALAAAGVALLAICSYYLLVVGRRGQRSKQPKKRYAPVVGTVFHQLYHVRRLHDYHADLFRKRKTVQLLAPAGRRQIYTCDPAVVEHILRTNFANYGKVSTEHSKLIIKLVYTLLCLHVIFCALQLQVLSLTTRQTRTPSPPLAFPRTSLS